MKTVQVTCEDLKILLERSKVLGTVEQWAVVALQWAEHADEEIRRLQAKVKGLTPIDPCEGYCREHGGDDLPENCRECGKVG